MAIFFFAGISDMIDGPLARRIRGGASELGATIDSIADVIMVCVGIFVIIPQMQIWSWLWPAYVSIITLKVFASTGIGFIRFKEIISLHTIALKILVIVLFSFPLLYYFIGPGLFINIYATVTVSCALLIVIEEILIISLTKQPERNIKSILNVKAANAAATANKS
jgi:CDP-diacylglycerol--glycerol-3-phosphate 3-phosphatidyltransferase